MYIETGIGKNRRFKHLHILLNMEREFKRVLGVDIGLLGFKYFTNHTENGKYYMLYLGIIGFHWC